MGLMDALRILRNYDTMFVEFNPAPMGVSVSVGGTAVFTAGARWTSSTSYTYTPEWSLLCAGPEWIVCGLGYAIVGQFNNAVSVSHGA